MTSELRHDLAREELEAGDVLLVEALEQYALEPGLFPGLEVGDDALGRSREEGCRVPRALVGGQGGEDGADPGDALGDLRRVAPDRAGNHERARNRLGVAAEGAAVLGQHLPFLGEAGDVHARHVPLVRELGDDLERALLAAAADDDAIAAARRERVALGLFQREERLLQGDGLALLERANEPRARLEAVEPLLDRREWHAEHLVLVLVPARAETEIEPPA